MDNLNYLKEKLAKKKSRINDRYAFYEMKDTMPRASEMIPPNMRWITECLGWCGKAVDSLADRLVVTGFRNDNFDFTEIYKQNNSDILFDSAILSALISSCSFIYLSPVYDENNRVQIPNMQVIDGAHATGIIDDVTGLLKEGYAVLEYDLNDDPIKEAYFEPYRTTYYEKGKEPYHIDHTSPYPLLVPCINRPDAKRPFGHSRISRACMELQKSAKNVLRNIEIAGEYNSHPQKYVLGMAEDAEFNGRLADLSSFLRIDKDEEGDRPVLGQFQQITMNPYVEQIKMLASLFSGETGLTLDDLGFAGANPSSAEAIKATHESLRLTAKKAQRTFGTGFINAGYLAATLRDEKPYKRAAIYETSVAWMPLFEPDSSALSGIGDGILKINQSIPEYINNETMRDLTGIIHYE